MLIEEQRRRQDLLKARILELAKESLDESEIRKEVLRLLDIYSGGFRHSYADFFPIISEISQNEQIYSLDFLTNNLSCPGVPAYSSRTRSFSVCATGNRDFSVRQALPVMASRRILLRFR